MGVTDVDTGRRGSGPVEVLLRHEGQPEPAPAPAPGLSFVGTVSGDKGTPLNGVKVRFTVAGDRIELADRDDNQLDSWKLLEPPIPHRSGYYLRTEHGLVLAEWCHECNGQVKAGFGGY